MKLAPPQSTQLDLASVTDESLIAANTIIELNSSTPATDQGKFTSLLTVASAVQIGPLSCFLNLLSSENRRYQKLAITAPWGNLCRIVPVFAPFKISTVNPNLLAPHNNS